MGKWNYSFVEYACQSIRLVNVYENTVKVLCISLAVLRMSVKYHHEDGEK